jgi:hypothetical protein
MTTRLAIASATLLSGVLIAPGTPLTPDQSVGAQQRQSSAGADASQRDQQPSNTQDMMKMHDRMMAEMKAANAKLDQLVQKMDAATGDAKVNATAGVVKELVAQHKAMHDRMGQMHQQMMGGRGMMNK